MLAFLAYAGTRAGAVIVAALRSDLGWRIALVGAGTAAVLALAVPLAGRLLHDLAPARLAGVAAGAQTQPAVLAYANERTGFDARVSLGYALVFPAAMIVKIVAAQLLAGG